MFIGHFAVAFAVKRVAPEVKLGTAVVAAQLLDLIWPLLVMFSYETVTIEPGHTQATPLNFVSYPYSHSLLMAAVWAVLFGLIYWRRTSSKRGAAWMAAAVLSHWVLDFLSHSPDLPLMPGQATKVGLGLWSSLPATVVVELGMLAVGLALYLSVTRARDRRGVWGLWLYVALLIVSYAGALFGPPPPNISSVILPFIVGIIVMLTLAYWIDRHRETVKR